MIQIYNKQWVGQFDWFRHKDREGEFYQIIDINKAFNINLNTEDLEEIENHLKNQFKASTASPVNITFAQWILNNENKFIHANTMQCM